MKIPSTPLAMARRIEAASSSPQTATRSPTRCARAIQRRLANRPCGSSVPARTLFARATARSGRVKSIPSEMDESSRRILRSVGRWNEMTVVKRSAPAA